MPSKALKEHASGPPRERGSWRMWRSWPPGGGGFWAALSPSPSIRTFRWSGEPSKPWEWPRSEWRQPHKAYVKEHMRRLYWLITEEAGAVFWRAPECMAECCARLPAFSRAISPSPFTSSRRWRRRIWSTSVLAPSGPSVASSMWPGMTFPTVLPLVIEALDRPDPQARGMAVWCLGEVGETRAPGGPEGPPQGRGAGPCSTGTGSWGKRRWPASPGRSWKRRRNGPGLEVLTF